MFCETLWSMSDEGRQWEDDMVLFRRVYLGLYSLWELSARNDIVVFYKYFTESIWLACETLCSMRDNGLKLEGVIVYSYKYNFRCVAFQTFVSAT